MTCVPCQQSLACDEMRMWRTSVLKGYSLGSLIFQEQVTCDDEGIAFQTWWNCDERFSHYCCCCCCYYDATFSAIRENTAYPHHQSCVYFSAKCETMRMMTRCYAYDGGVFPNCCYGGEWISRLLEPSSGESIAFRPSAASWVQVPLCYGPVENAFQKYHYVWATGDERRHHTWGHRSVCQEVDPFWLSER